MDHSYSSSSLKGKIGTIGADYGEITFQVFVSRVMKVLLLAHNAFPSLALSDSFLFTNMVYSPLLTPTNRTTV